MRAQERRRGLLRAPRLAWDVLVRGRYEFIYDRMPVALRAMALRKRLNLFRSGANLLYRRAAPWSMPLHMQFELTSYCNLRCPVCPAGTRSVKRPAQAMDVELFRRAFDEAGPYLLTASLWAWGEPLLHPRLEDILRAARRHDTVLLLSTNGQNLDRPGVVEALLRQPPSHLIVAIDGLTDETNSRFRVGARLQPLLAGVRMLAERKRQAGRRLPLLHMRYIVMKHNEHELPGVEDFARQNGFDLLSMRTLSLIDTAAPDTVHWQFVPEACAWQAYEYGEAGRVNRPGFVCQEPFWFPTLFADGTVVACEQDFDAQQPLGAMSPGVSFSQVWRRPHAAQVRARIRDRAQELSFCRNCPYAGRSGTDVSVDATFLNPEIDYPDVLRMQKMEGDRA
jgi:MoaA/NifB/PqqE/SkfB family radical SAM enzyme